MKRNSNRANDEVVLAAAAAKLHLEKKLNQTVIGKELGIHQTEVSRLLKKSDHVITNWSPSPPTGMSKKEFLRQVDERLSTRVTRQILESISGDEDFKVDIVYEPTRLGDAQTGFDPRVGAKLSRLIKRATLVGVAWDLDIKPYDDHISGFVTRARGKNQEPIQFIPLCGITEYGTDALIKSSTVVAMRYHRTVNKDFEGDKKCPKLLNLNCIPLVHPPPKKESNSTLNWSPISEDVRCYIKDAFPDYEEIFGSMSNSFDRVDPAGLAFNVDMIISGIGETPLDSDRLLDFLYPNDEKISIKIPGIKDRTIEKTRLKHEIIIGDIAGVLLPRTHNADTDFNRKIVDHLNSRLATLRPVHLQRCRTKALKQNYDFRNNIANINRQAKTIPGVVVVAHGEDKCEALLSAIAEGYVSRVIIDDSLANAIEKLKDRYLD